MENIFSCHSDITTVKYMIIYYNAFMSFYLSMNFLLFVPVPITVDENLQ